LFQARENFLNQVPIGGAADEGLFHFGDGVGAAHQDFDGGVVEGGLGVDGAGFEHAGKFKSRRGKESKTEKDNAEARRTRKFAEKDRIGKRLNTEGTEVGACLRRQAQRTRRKSTEDTEKR
jgi:hypothetical protein